ncbi:uncharacterized protein LOC127266448 isoform X1 [Andrographis paniculata]|uniref:uncharacterized protein LOC127266448 isoform X1 n=1 Tax=Andrographis paniculata TaxID=175694 RepID=UPI0021E6FE7C|nr:uncharacterized protein LOC127266448 isoform X1 [Andrographis paniculata]
MSYSNSSMSSGSRAARRTPEFGGTYVVRPKGKHQATILWLHGLGDNGSSWSQMLESLPLPNVSLNTHGQRYAAINVDIYNLKWNFPVQIKWICPTAPTRHVTSLGGFPCTAWFDTGELSDEGPDDIEGLDASAAHIANLLSAEPANIKVAVGGFSMGAAAALYSATCFAQGKYGNGSPFPVNLRAVIGLSGWLPGARSLRNKIEASADAARRAAWLPIFLSHGLCDDVVPYTHGERSYRALSIAGFRNLVFNTYEEMGHYTNPKEMDDVCNWLRMVF